MRPTVEMILAHDAILKEKYYAIGLLRSDSCEHALRVNEETSLRCAASIVGIRVRCRRLRLEACGTSGMRSAKLGIWSGGLSGRGT